MSQIFMDAAEEFGEQYTVSAYEDTGMSAYPGHIFRGWGKTGDGPVTLSAGETFTASSPRTVLYAQWESDPDGYTIPVSLFANGKGGVDTIRLNSPYAGGRAEFALERTGQAINGDFSGIYLNGLENASDVWKTFSAGTNVFEAAAPVSRTQLTIHSTTTSGPVTLTGTVTFLPA